MTLLPAEAVRSLLASAVTLPERWASGAPYNPLTASMAANPYPGYARLRESSPVHRSRLLGAWIVTRYADVDAILRDHARYANDPRKADLPRRQRRRLPPDEELTMLTLDPPDHTRLRALVNRAFTRTRVNALEPRIREITSGLLNAVEDLSAFDLIERVAQPLPVVVIAEMLGIPAQDRDQFKAWSDRRARLLEPTVSMRERRSGLRASHELEGYLAGIIAQRRREPREDILSALVQAEEEGDRLSERELLNMVRVLLVGGNETTTNLIGNGMFALMRNPGELERLRQDPSLIPSAVDEMLRYDSPVQATFRRALVDSELHGTLVRARETLVLVLAAGNRDPEAFEEPDRLDVGRNGHTHLSFSRGIHHCLGAALARLEARVAFEMLLDRYRRIELVDPRPRFRPNIVLRGLRSLALRCTRA